MSSYEPRFDEYLRYPDTFHLGTFIDKTNDDIVAAMQCDMPVRQKADVVQTILNRYNAVCDSKRLQGSETIVYSGIDLDIKDPFGRPLCFSGPARALYYGAIASVQPTSDEDKTPQIRVWHSFHTLNDPNGVIPEGRYVYLPFDEPHFTTLEAAEIAIVGNTMYDTVMTRFRLREDRDHFAVIQAFDALNQLTYASPKQRERFMILFLHEINLTYPTDGEYSQIEAKAMQLMPYNNGKPTRIYRETTAQTFPMLVMGYGFMNRFTTDAVGHGTEIPDSSQLALVGICRSETTNEEIVTHIPLKKLLSVTPIELNDAVSGADADTQGSLD